MKVLMLSTSLRGGAGGAPHRLHRSLRAIGTDSRVLVMHKDGDEQTVIATRSNTAVAGVRRMLRLCGCPEPNNLPLRKYKDSLSTSFYAPWLPNYAFHEVQQTDPDVINLHWVCGNWLRLEQLLKFRKPLVWTLHDMWAFTGGCVYSGDCDRYRHSCGACPQLGSQSENDLSRREWRRKAKTWDKLALTIVTPSAWLAKCARSSSLLGTNRIEVIPNGIDTNVFRPIDQVTAREILQLPRDKHLVLFGAWGDTLRKGFQHLVPALRELAGSGWGDSCALAVFGRSNGGSDNQLALPTTFMGKLEDPVTLALAYSAADVYVHPSLEDNLPTTVLESLACGTPVVAFNVGGVPEMVEHGENGYLARPFEVPDLAHGIASVLSDTRDRAQVAASARARIEKDFTLELFARRYQALFDQVAAPAAQASG